MPIRLHPKVKAFADRLLSDPKISHTQAYIDTHQTVNRSAAKTQAYKNLSKPHVQIYLKKHVDLAKRTSLEVMERALSGDTPTWQRLAADQAERIMDRELGKPIQRQETQNTNLNLNVQASQELSERFTEFLRTNTQVS